MFKTIFKIFFNTSFREAWAVRYETYGAVRKTLILLLITALTAGAIVCEFISFSLYKENVGLGIITSILFIALGVLAFRFSLFFAGVALKMAIHGTVSIGLFAKRKAKKELANAVENAIETTTAESAEENAPVGNENQIVAGGENGQIVENDKKQNKVLDYLIGILGFIYAIGVIVVLVAVLINKLQSLQQ